MRRGKGSAAPATAEQQAIVAYIAGLEEQITELGAGAGRAAGAHRAHATSSTPRSRPRAFMLSGQTKGYAGRCVTGRPWGRLRLPMSICGWPREIFPLLPVGSIGARRRRPVCTPARRRSCALPRIARQCGGEGARRRW